MTRKELIQAIKDWEIEKERLLRELDQRRLELEHQGDFVAENLDRCYDQDYRKQLHEARNMDNPRSILVRIESAERILRFAQMEFDNEKES